MTDKTILCIGAHPDDESFWPGGTLVILARNGVNVHVLSATRGQAGLCGEPPLCRPEELGQLREQELRCACRLLGAHPPYILDYYDGKLAQVPDDEGVTQVLEVMRAVQPQVLLTWAPNGGSGHPDHVTISRWTQLAFDRSADWGASAPVAVYHMVRPVSVARATGRRIELAVPDDQVDLTVDVGPVLEQRMAALRCHRTQVNPRIRSATREELLALFGTEYYCRAATRSPVDGSPGDWMSAAIMRPA